RSRSSGNPGCVVASTVHQLTGDESVEIRARHAEHDDPSPVLTGDSGRDHDVSNCAAFASRAAASVMASSTVRFRLRLNSTRTRWWARSSTIARSRRRGTRAAPPGAGSGSTPALTGRGPVTAYRPLVGSLAATGRTSSAAPQLQANTPAL